MNGQSRDQASDSSDGSPGEPAFSQSSASALHQRYMSFKSRETVEDQSHQKATQKLPPAGSIVLAVYETESEFRAGILSIHEVVETDTADSGCEFRNSPFTGSRYYSPSCLLTVAELQLEADHQPGQSLQWAKKIRLSGTSILFLESLACVLRSEHLPACRPALKRLQVITNMLNLSRDDSTLFMS